jgi:hypothetical protein
LIIFTFSSFIQLTIYKHGQHFHFYKPFFVFNTRKLNVATSTSSSAERSHGSH